MAGTAAASDNAIGMAGVAPGARLWVVRVLGKNGIGTEGNVAARCVASPSYARTVLSGEDHPEVREAIMADLIDGAEVRGFFNPQPDPPGRPADLSRFELVFEGWSQLPLTNLKALVVVQA